MLSKTQEELSSLRKKNNTKRAMSKSASACSNITMVNSNKSSSSIAEIEDDDDYGNTIQNGNVGLRASSSLFSPWMPTSNTSLAVEVFTSLAKDYRTKNSTL